MDSTSALNAAIEFYKQRQYQEARGLLRRALCKQPDDGKLWELLGIAHHALGNRAQAVHALESATMLVPLSAGGQCVLAKCYAARGHSALAREMYGHLLSTNNLPGELLPVIASGLGAMGEFALALDACRRAAACELDDGQPLYGMAHYMERLGHPPEMITFVLRKAVEIEPDCFRYRFALANTCYQMGQLEEAYTTLCDGVEPTTLNNIGCAHCVRRMQAIFQARGDRKRSTACRQRLDDIIAGNQGCSVCY